MKTKHITYCRPDGSRYNWENTNLIGTLPGPLSKFGRVKVTFEKYIPMKSLPQLGFYRGGILPFLEKHLFIETGMTCDDWHYTLKEMHGKKKEDKSGCFEVVVSHAEYTEKDMSEFIGKVKQWAWDFFQVDIPGPNRIEEFI